MKAIVLSGYGINSDEELASAFRMAGADAELVHISDLLDEPARLAGAEFLGFSGGFSFGDHLGSALVLANIFRLRMMSELKSFVADGGMIIGICNGFQALVKMGLLPGFDESNEPLVSLVHNDCGHYLDQWVDLKFESASICKWTAGLNSRMLPIRHGEGKFLVKDDEVLKTLEKQRQIALRYEGLNPNGSVANIAGICDPSGRVLGLMPHPEASIFNDLHPYRRREIRGGLGLEIFENAIKNCKESV